MFFSVKHFYAFGKASSYIKDSVEEATGRKFSRRTVAHYLKACKQAIVQRETDVVFDLPADSFADGYEDLYKWYRPWEVVPELRDFQAPEGDYGVGIEIEMGFTSLTASRAIATAISKWRNIAIDIEGGTHPIEATFPPFLYSKMNSKRQPFRYLKLLRDNASLVQRHDRNSCIGTHVNVSAGGRVLHYSRVNELSRRLSELFGSAHYGHRQTNTDLAVKYFGRSPYGLANGMSGGGGNVKYIEYKLFNSTTDGKALRRYINVAVALTELVASDRTIDNASVLEALEAGYNKN